MKKKCILCFIFLPHSWALGQFVLSDNWWKNYLSMDFNGVQLTGISQTIEYRSKYAGNDNRRWDQNSKWNADTTITLLNDSGLVQKIITKWNGYGYHDCYVYEKGYLARIETKEDDKNILQIEEYQYFPDRFTVKKNTGGPNNFVWEMETTYLNTQGKPDSTTGWQYSSPERIDEIRTLYDSLGRKIEVTYNLNAWGQAETRTIYEYDQGDTLAIITIDLGDYAYHQFIIRDSVHKRITYENYLKETFRQSKPKLNSYSVFYFDPQSLMLTTVKGYDVVKRNKFKVEVEIAFD